MSGDTFWFREHNDLVYKLVAAARTDITIFDQMYGLEEDLQIELLNVLYCVTENGFEVNYNLAASPSKISGARNKILGVRKGWPDLTCIWAQRIAFLELKSEIGTVKKAQRECHTWLRECGFEIAPCIKTIGQALEFLVPLGLPIKLKYAWIKDIYQLKTE